MRTPNEIDFWRGFALITIYINHIPGIYFERFTYRSLSLSDSAELFVFLAGWSMRLSIAGKDRPISPGRLVLRLGGRAVTLYIAQMVITEIAIAMLASASLLLDAPFLLDWHNASAVFREPIEANIGLVLLTHQLGYFNILPLYVVLMAAAPLIALIDRYAKPLLLPVSASLYLYVLARGINLHTWPVDGVWFLNPLSWQLIYVLGFVIADKDGIGAFARKHLFWLKLAALPIVLLGALAAFTHFSPSPIDVPEPKLFFMFDKTFLSPARLIHVLALVVLFAGSYKVITPWIPYSARFLSMLGRNSLNVFCVGSVLSLAGQIFRFAIGGDIASDAFLVILGLSIMGLAAWVSEWRDRLREAPASPVSASLSASS
ncbi:OpgC family protein [Methyloferula stellata]|uniref:OpgC family protein n=1 Tax=Methyloferula stellata TaxID=876270 RepID=UPI00037BA683|nr:OpgC domain-containing protein [Methyloferula stellata]